MIRRPLSGSSRVRPFPPMSESAKVVLAREWFRLLAVKDFDGLEALITPDVFEYRFLPASLGRAPLNKDQFFGFLNNGLRVLTSSGTIKIDPIEVIDAPSHVVVHGKAYDTFGRDGILPFTGEWIFIIKFEETNNGPKIASIKEFMDSAFALDFRAKNGTPAPA